MSINSNFPLRNIPRLTDDLIVCSFAGITYVFNLSELKWIRLEERCAPDGLWFGTTGQDYTERNRRIEELRTAKYADRKIDSLIVIPTWDCQGKCAYCYAKEHGSKEDLTIARLLKTLDDRSIRSEDIKSTIIIGGEPLMNPSLVKFVIDYFHDAEHTMCTGLECPDENLEDILWFGQTRKNFEMSVSVDPKNSPRYASASYERSIEWCRKFASAGLNVRAKATLYPQSLDLCSVRRDLGDIRIDADGVAYGFRKLGRDEHFPELMSMFEREFVRIITENVPTAQSFLFFGPSIIPLVNSPETFVPNNCGCGFSYATIDSSGRMTYCDSPGKEELDANFDHPNLREQVISVRQVCSDCALLPVCGGTCEVQDDKEFFCIVRMVKFAYTMFSFFVNMEKASV